MCNCYASFGKTLADIPIVGRENHPVTLRSTKSLAFVFIAPRGGGKISPLCLFFFNLFLTCAERRVYPSTEEKHREIKADSQRLRVVFLTNDISSERGDPRRDAKQFRLCGTVRHWNSLAVSVLRRHGWVCCGTASEWIVRAQGELNAMEYYE
jgi:hypothetical protein